MNTPRGDQRGEAISINYRDRKKETKKCLHFWRNKATEWHDLSKAIFRDLGSERLIFN